MRLNEQGAGIFVTVNATNFKGRETTNIIRVRALWVDLDGAPLAPVTTWRAPHIVVASSPGKFHAYWRVTDVALEAFSDLQKSLAAKFNGDKSVHDLPRVMRLPGFLHRKGEPFLTHIVSTNDHAPYTVADFDLPPDYGHKGPLGTEGLDDGDPLNTAALANLGKWVPALFGDAAHWRSDEKGYRVRSADAGHPELEEDLSIHPTGIKDFGVHDIGDKRKGGRTAVDLVMLYGQKERIEAREWLRVQLGMPKEETINRHVAELNKMYALVMVGDKAAVMRETATEGIRFWAVTSFSQWLANRSLKFQTTEGVKNIPLAQYWLRHPQRRQYEGIVFDPTRLVVPGHYNLWRGFTVEPIAGDCTKFLAHLKDNVARGDEYLFRWVIGFFAHIMQHPDKKEGTALALRGLQGVGKTKVGEIIGALLGPHYALVADPRYVTGRFNSHMVSLLLLHCDEAFWAGDHTAEGKVKDLTTGHSHFIELKGKEPVRVNNLLRLFVTGNPQWIVPAGFGERRFAVLDVGEDHKEDHAYFAAIDKEMDNGGREALLHYLLNFHLSTVNLRVIPKTAALLDQKIASLTVNQNWWLDVLQRGELPELILWSDAFHCSCYLLHENYIKRTNQTGRERKSTETTLGMFLAKMVPGLKRIRPTVAKGKSAYVYEFPSLAICREHFVKMVQSTITWDEPAAEWAEDPGM